jgi:dihydroflavonol-4-reductase
VIDLVTGASGFIGSALARRLVAEGRTVRALVRASSRHDLIGPVEDRLQLHAGDVTDPSSLVDAFEGVGRVFHCAGRIGYGGRREGRRLFAVNVGGTANVLDAAERGGARRVVLVSSVAAIGRPAGPERPVDENAEWTDSRMDSAYGRSKYLAELEGQRAVAEGLDVVIVNPSLVFGPGRPDETTMRIVELVRRGRARAYPAGGTNVVDVEDVVTGILAAMDRGQTGRRYILGSENLTWKEIFDILADAFGRPRPRFRVPPAALAAAGALSELASLLGTPRVGLSRESARIASGTVRFDDSRARTELAWSPRPFAETAAHLASTHPG